MSEETDIVPLPEPEPDEAAPEPEEPEYETPEPEELEEEPEERAPKRRGGRHRLTIVLVAVLVGGLIAAGATWALGGFRNSGAVGETGLAVADHPEGDDFTSSGAGDCLTWDEDGTGEPVVVDCAEPHRFEIASVIDTSAFPAAEFDRNAPLPSAERFAQLRDENCPFAVADYLAGQSSGLDPQGRFTPGMMFPSPTQWDRGWRGLRCGIQQPGPEGTQEEFTGRVAEVDQAFAWEPGTCIGIDTQTKQPTRFAVECSEPHAFQTTAIVDLSRRFGDRASGKPWPPANEQEAFWRTVCPSQTNRFFGGEEKFAATTLNVQASTIDEAGWLVGSRLVVCFVALPDGGGFATLVGDAREALLINGKLPVAPDAGPPGRALPTPVPLPPGYSGSDAEVPAPAGG